jgi:hypothetical protein
MINEMESIAENVRAVLRMGIAVGRRRNDYFNLCSDFIPAISLHVAPYLYRPLRTHPLHHGVPIPLPTFLSQVPAHFGDKYFCLSFISSASERASAHQISPLHKTCSSLAFSCPTESRTMIWAAYNKLSTNYRTCTSPPLKYFNNTLKYYLSKKAGNTP